MLVLVLASYGSKLSKSYPLDKVGWVQKIAWSIEGPPQLRQLSNLG